MPGTPEQITGDWVNAVLRRTGMIGDSEAASIQVQVVGAETGFTSSVARVELSYDKPGTEGPRSLIVKLPSPHRRNRAVLEMLNVYEHEVRFYREIAGSLAVRVPRCYFGVIEAQSFSGLRRALRVLIKAAPARLTSLLAMSLVLLLSVRVRRFVLLLEDFDGTTQGDQLAGCTAEQAAGPLRALASLHATFWETSGVAHFNWLPVAGRGSKLMLSGFRRGRAAFLQRYGQLLAPESSEVLVWLEDHGDDLLDYFREFPMTVVHGDYRLDNLFWADSSTPGSVAVIDWQGIHRGPGVTDLAYFLASSLSPEVSDQDEARLVCLYHEELRQNGVEGYPLEQCHHNYEVAKLVLVCRLVSGIDFVDLGEGRGKALRECFVARVFARLPQPPYERFLSAAGGIA